MTNIPTILRDSLLALPVLAAVGYGLLGASGLWGTLVAGSVAIVNLMVFGLLVRWIVRASVRGGGVGAVLLVPVKMFAMIGAYAWLMSRYPGSTLALGLGAPLLGMSVRPLVAWIWSESPSASVLVSIEEL